MSRDWPVKAKDRIHPTKTDKIGRIDMSDGLAAELSDLRRQRREEYLKRGKNEIPEWTFCNSDGGTLDVQNLKNRHSFKCLDKAKLRRIRFHDLAPYLRLVAASEWRVATVCQGTDEAQQHQNDR